MTKFYPLANYAGYSISKCGIVRKDEYIDSAGFKRKEKILKRVYGRNVVIISDENGNKFRIQIAHLMADQWLAEGWRQDYVVRFLDRDTNNLNLSNLALQPKALHKADLEIAALSRRLVKSQMA